MLPHGFIDVVGAVCDGLFGLIGHVGVGDFGDRGKEEHDGQEEDENGDAEIHPLHGLERLAAWCADVFENHIRGEDGGDDRSNGLKGLRKVQTHIRVSRRTAGGDEGISGSFEGGKTGPDDEHGAAETSKTTIDAGRPEHQGTDAIDAETGDERPSVTVAAYDPAGIGERTDEISTVDGQYAVTPRACVKIYSPKVCSSQTRSLCFGDTQHFLKVLVQDIEETICETPKEEEDGDERDGDDGLSGGDLRSTGDGLVTDALPSSLVVEGFDRGRPSLGVDILESRLRLLAEHLELIEGGVLLEE